MEIIALVVLVFIFISQRSLSGRVASLEAKLRDGVLKEKKQEFVSNAQPVSNFINPSQPFTSSGEQPVFQSASPITNGSVITPQNDNSGKFVAWLKDDWLMKLGAFLFIIGFGWFISYAFANNWIGPVGRISLGIAGGAVIMGLGFWRMTKYPSQGALFMALGAGMAMLTIFAGRALYGFFTPVSAVGIDFLIVAFVSFASYRFNVRTLAYTAQILAFVAPLLTAGITDSFFLFSYLFFISLATLVLASITGWRGLIVTSLIFVGFYSLPYITASSNNYYGGSMYSMNAPFILNFAYLFGLLYLFAGMFAVIKKGVVESQKEIFLAVLNGFFLFLWIYNVANDDWKTLIFAAWAVVFTVSSFVASRYSSKLDPFYAYGSVAVAFIAAATAAQLDGVALTVAFAIEAFLIVVVVLALTKNVKVASVASSLFITPVLMSLSSVGNYAMSEELLTKDLFVLVLMAALLILMGRLITWDSKENKESGDVKAGPAIIIIGTLYIWFTLWQFIHILLIHNPDMATMTTLVIFTIAGLVAYFAGLYGNDTARRIYGTAVLVFVVIRLMVIDVWAMDLFGRVITFFAIGVLLMSTAFLTKKRKKEVVG